MFENYKEKSVPWGPAGYITYKRTYSRLKESGTTEEWWETVRRCVNAIYEIGIFSEEEIHALYDHVFNLRCCFSGRALWQLGTNTVKRFGGDSLQNCWAVSVEEPIRSFCFTFDELMLGGGVGFNIQAEHVYAMPSIKYLPKVERKESSDVDFIVPDNREGWVLLLGKVLKSHFFSGKNLTYSTQCIRPRGKEIKSFGGVASGSEELVKGIDLIVGILRSRYGKKLTPVNCLDIQNIIGAIVVSGNVRRSAELALGDSNDSDFINAKNWEDYNIPNHRAMSNNSVVCSDINNLPSEFWNGYNGKGEAYGLINLDVCRAYGRLVDGHMYRPDTKVIGVNPCAEITLESYEACNLVEIFLPNIKDASQFMEIAGLMYKVAKSVSTLPFIHKETQRVVARNRRLGISVTGFMQSKFRHDVDVFNTVYQHLEQLDKVYSKRLGIGPSIKLTTIKPSGTLSLLPGVTPGMHCDIAPYYIRRIRFSSDDKLIPILRSHGYPVEPQMMQDGEVDLNVMVVSIPIKASPDAITADEVSAIDQLETQLWLQRYWSDNSVSATIYYMREELDDIQKWLKDHLHEVKTCSFLLHSEHGFKQPPLEPINMLEYNDLNSKIQPLEYITEKEERDLIDSLECSKGGCPIK